MDIENLNTNGFPDESELEKIANQLFKSAPGGLQNNSGFSEQVHNQYEHNDTLKQSDGVNDLGKISPNLVNNNNLGFGKVTKSVAGSGISPSAINHPSDFSVEDPQTSLPDPHFYNGQIPKSVAGSGKSPSLQNQDLTHGNVLPHNKLPFETEQPFEHELKEVLSQINSTFPTSQLPHVSAFGINENSYYFLTGQNPLQYGNQLFGGANQNQNTHGISSYVKPPFDINLVKADFPILKERVNGKPLIWLDNAATTQKPKLVIDRINHFYEHENSNIHRAAHELAARSTDAYEAARKKVQHFINAGSVNEIVFVRGTTEAINLVAQSWGYQNLNAGDEIIVSNLEHHANIVPWQILAAKKGLKLRVIPVDDDGQILLDEYAKLFNSKTKLVSFTHVSNALGTVTPAQQMIEMAHANGAKVLLDGAQSVSHMRVDLQKLNPDFFVFSGHKVFGPTGIGVLYGKEEILNSMQPWQGGGNMIKDVTFEHTEYHNAPGRFEAGTGNIADAVGLGAAIDYVNKIGIDLISQYEHGLLVYGTNLLKQVPGLRLVGTAADKASVLSFTLDGFTNDQVGQELNKEGIAVRTGHHCAQPILRRFGLESTVRPSLAFYNTCADVDALVTVLHRLKSNQKRSLF
jgi:cysteine desulfurase/selenocysteine lyase